MEDEKLVWIKEQATLAASEAAERIDVRSDRLQVILDAVWEMIEPETRKQPEPASPWKWRPSRYSAQKLGLDELIELTDWREHRNR